MRRWSMWVLLALFPALLLAAPRAFLDRDSIRLGETVTLNVETDARNAVEPDFSVLDKDFRRLGTSSQTSLSIVAGRRVARTLWAVALEPRGEGRFEIPAFTLGAESTAPLTLTVLPMPAGGSSAAGDDVYLEIDAQPSDPYVQQQVSYVVRLYFAVTLLEGQLQEPQVTGAQVRRLGQDVTYQKTISDRRYSVVERRYALVPEASGRLDIPGPQFAGRALLSGSYGNALGANAVLNARGNAVALQVRPRPPGAPTPWLPAQSLELFDESGALPQTLEIGEPLTLTIRMLAQGLAAEQLPELQLPKVDGAEIYPDQETPSTGVESEWLRGERVRKFALVPTRPGRLELPQVSIAWWDVRKDRATITSLPARSFEVVGTSATAANATPPLPDDAASVTVTGQGDAARVSSAFDWHWPAATVFFALLWLATLAWRRNSAAPRSVLRPRAADPVRVDRRKRWNAALQSNDGPAAAQALIVAARERDPQVHNLGDVVERLDDDTQRAAVLRLEQVLYRGGEPAEVLATLRAVFAPGPRWRTLTGRVSAQPDDTLPPLYPER